MLEISATMWCRILAWPGSTARDLDASRAGAMSGVAVDASNAL